MWYDKRLVSKKRTVFQLYSLKYKRICVNINIWFVVYHSERGGRMKQRYDVIVVGAGNGGLAAAAWMAKEGKKVLLLEKHNIPGGCAGSIVRGRFEFELTLHELCQMGPEGTGEVRKLLDELGTDVEWIAMDEAFHTINTHPVHGFDVEMPIGPEAFVDEMEKEVPGSRPAMENLMEINRMISDAIAWLASYQNDPPKAQMLMKWSDFMKMATVPADEMLKKLGLPDKAREIYESYWDYLSVDCTRVSFVVYSFMVYTYLTRKPYIARKRSFEIVLALEQRIRDFGGEIRYNTKVKRIDIKNNQARGVELIDGTYIPCNRIISNIMPTVAFGKMIEPKEVPVRDKKLCNARTLGPSGFVIYLGLDASADELGIRGYDTFVRETADTRILFEKCKTRASHRKIFNYSCLNRAVSDASPEGTCMIMFLLLYTEDAFADVTEENYFRIKDQIVEETIDYFEQAAKVSIRDHIEELVTASPVTLARYVGTPQGNCYGYAVPMWDGMLPRTMSGEKEDYTIKGLRFCGGHGTQMDGYSQAYLSGREVARYTLKDMREGR